MVPESMERTSIVEDCGDLPQNDDSRSQSRDAAIPTNYSSEIEVVQDDDMRRLFSAGDSARRIIS